MEQLSLFTGDTLASLLVMPGTEKARMMTVTSGRRLSDYWKRSDPVGLLAKMLLDTSLWGSTTCFLNWTTSGTPRNRLLFRLVPSTPHTDETEYSLLPTPLSTDATHGGPNQRDSKGNYGLSAVAQARDYRSGDDPDGPRAQRKREQGWSPNLHDVVKMWPTPKASIRGDCPSERRRNTPDLAAAVKMWPTPRANDAEKRGNINPNEPRNGLPAAVKLFPTPQASDNRDRGNLSNPSIQRRIESGKQVNLSMCVSETSGQLNPMWVEWLMGFPIGWTDLKPSEMQSFHSKSIPS